jgi:uncharacterized protein DUF3883
MREETKVTGRSLAKRWGLRVKHALYRKTGDWYHQLRKFPGALLDADGYVIFESEEAFKACPQLQIGKDPVRHGGWVSATESFDLLCRDADRTLRVEVKGTTSQGSSVLVTRNEVRHAQEHDGCVALFVVSNIAVNASGCSGGTVRVFDPWDIRTCELEPIAFECRLGAGPDGD